MQPHSLSQSATMMRIVGWVTLVILPAALVAFPSGFLWGTHPASPHHPPLSPYLFMLIAMYVAWAILMIRGASDPLGYARIVDYGLLANLLHALVMLVQSFVYEHELMHLVGDVPALFVVCAVLLELAPGASHGSSRCRQRSGDREI